VILTVEHLGVSFGGLKALYDVSTQVQEGECLGIIGPNGAGKTTFFNLLTGFLRPTQGLIFLESQDVSQLSAAKRSQLGMVRTFQIVSPFKRLSVVEQLMVAIWAKHPLIAKCEVRDRSLDILARVGLQTHANQPAENLSHGDQKRLEIARVVAASPRVALFDEPAGGLSHREISGVIALIHELNSKGLTVLLVEHVLHVVREVCHRVMVLSEGSKIAEGSPKEISQNPEVISAYLGREVATFAGN
jgi:branched-chain amino acid transport system ATP-binding protein